MRARRVSFSEDAYVALASLKNEGESFSDVVCRLAPGNRSLLEFAADRKDFPEEKMTAYLSLLETGDRPSRIKLRRELGRGAVLASRARRRPGRFLER